MIGCFAIVLGAALPRFTLFLLWLFTNYLDRAFDTNIWPFLGFLVLPTTTLGYAVGANEFPGTSWAWVFAAIGALVDLGLVGGGYRQRDAVGDRRGTL